MSAGSNRLPILAANIRAAHESVLDEAKTAAERAVEAGQALLEEKTPLTVTADGCRGYARCRLSERTAPLSMAGARSGLKANRYGFGADGRRARPLHLYDESYEPGGTKRSEYSHCPSITLTEVATGDVR